MLDEKDPQAVALGYVDALIAAGAILGRFPESRATVVLGGEAVTDTTFDCQPPMDGLRECTWGVYNKPPSEPDPDDPCGGECCSGYQIIFKVDAAGAIDPASVFCVAPG